MMSPSRLATQNSNKRSTYYRNTKTHTLESSLPNRNITSVDSPFATNPENDTR